MCLGVPGKVVGIGDPSEAMQTGTVSFGGIRKQVCLAYVPGVQIGEYVIVHVGFAISRLDQAEAEEVFAVLREMEDLSELEIPQPE
jgi:hydrogenase expression/formation protein HypC